MNPVLLVIFGFAAAVMAVLGVYSIVSDLFLRDRTRVSQRVDDEFRTRQRERAQRSLLFKDLSVLNLEAAEEVGKENSWRERLDLLIDQSGVEIAQRRLFTFMAGAGVFVAVLVFLFSMNPFIALPAGLC